MKFLIFTVAAFAALQLSTCYLPASQSSEELMYQVKLKVLKDYLKEKRAMESIKEKIETVCPGYGDKFENITIEVAQCTNTVDEHTETMCSMVKNHFKRCMAPLTDMFEECLPEASQKIPTMIVDMVVATSKHICTIDGEHIFELGNPCVKSQNYRTQRCIRQLKTKVQSFSRKNPSAQDLCEFMASFRGCLQSHLQIACGNQLTRQAMLDLYDATASVCKTNQYNEIELIY